MSTNSSENNTIDLFPDLEISLSRSARFWIILFLDVPSVICSLCLIIHIIIDRTQRHALYNHTIFLILIVNLPVQLLDTGLYLSVIRNGLVQPSLPILCLLWLLVDYCFYCMGVILLTWLAIERHILIFYDQWVANQRGRFLFHYLPLILIISYVCLFYIVGIFVLPCDNVYDYTSLYCDVGPCLESYKFINLWETNFNYCCPVIIETVASISLLLRVQWQKRRLRRSNQWRKQRRMIMQLGLVSGINMVMNLPLYIVFIARSCGVATQSSTEAKIWFDFLSYGIVFFFPFASLCQFPVLRKQIIKTLTCIIARPSPPHCLLTISLTKVTPRK
ncbi:unnamed protein product [Adineta ricciae]|uniref:G-protein coupled receptors family 1 profile domain-containing protein n=1 Tax=Adineta ricciae TaxID=249248 RepID=A0A814Y3N6_ADIRI|nr:unnamed protein product [Adineta ricciae]CAF1437584.1 unnamed protein product [Adineta ricciae]